MKGRRPETGERKRRVPGYRDIRAWISEDQEIR